MNEEIKEILENIKKCCEIQKDNSFVVYQKQDIEKTLNYITNLQEENKKLKETNEEHRKINGQLREENNMLKKELKNKPDCEWTLETKDGQIMTIIQSERIDMQEKLNKSIQELFKKNQKLVKVIDELEKYMISEKERMLGEIGMHIRIEIDYILKKLTELKGGSNEK